MPTPLQKVLFVCVHNSCRSQMAEAYGRMLGKGLITPYSAGSRPSGSISMKAIASMRETGYDLGSHRTKSLDDLPSVSFDYVVTMGCGDACPLVSARKREEWEIPDPANMGREEFNEVRERIRAKVVRLIEESRACANTTSVS